MSDDLREKAIIAAIDAHLSGINEALGRDPATPFREQTRRVYRRQVEPVVDAVLAVIDPNAKQAWVNGYTAQRERQIRIEAERDDALRDLAELRAAVAGLRAVALEVGKWSRTTFDTRDVDALRALLPPGSGG